MIFFNCPKQMLLYKTVWDIEKYESIFFPIPLRKERFQSSQKINLIQRVISTTSFIILNYWTILILIFFMIFTILSLWIICQEKSWCHPWIIITNCWNKCVTKIIVCVDGFKHGHGPTIWLAMPIPFICKMSQKWSWGSFKVGHVSADPNLNIH